MLPHTPGRAATMRLFSRVRGPAAMADLVYPEYSWRAELALRQGFEAGPLDRHQVEAAPGGGAHRRERGQDTHRARTRAAQLAANQCSSISQETRGNAAFPVPRLDPHYCHRTVLGQCHPNIENELQACT